MKLYKVLEFNSYITQGINRLFPYTWTGNPTDAIKSKFLDLKDMSRYQKYTQTDFEHQVNDIKKMFKIGEKVKAIKMNSPFKSPDDPRNTVYGNIKDIKIDWTNETIRVFLIRPKALKIIEVYPETIEKYNKSFESVSYNHIKSFSEFIKE